MTTGQEWEQEFDLLYNSVNNNVAPALDAYEKSVFLTMAQEQVVRTLYSGGTLGQDSFEQSELLRRSLDSLIKEIIYHSTDVNIDPAVKQGTFGLTFELPSDSLYVVYEELSQTGKEVCGGNRRLTVVPTTHDVFYKTRNNPFRGANERRALRLDVADNTTEIVTTLSEYDYLVRYLRTPYPIILQSLTGGDTINGETEPYDYLKVCPLDESLHRIILSTAVQLAQAATMK